MSYRIDYGKVQRKRADGVKHLRLPVLTLLCFLIFLFLVENMWSEGRDLIRKVLFSADDILAVSALNTFASDLHNGERIQEAFSDFCKNVIP